MCFALIVYFSLIATGLSVYTVQLQKQSVPVEVNGSPVVHKTAYVGKVYAGFPNPQTFTVVFDTGSAHLFLPSTSCKTNTCLLHKRYNRSESESATDVDYDGAVVARDATERDQILLAYGTGDVKGEFVQEVVCLAPPAAHEWENDQRCTKARVVLAREMSDEPFQKFKFDGVLGLGMEALSLNPAFNFFGQMSRNTQMVSVFSLYLSQSDEENSEISFGGLNPARSAGPTHWVPIASPERGYWQIKIKRVFVGSQPVPFCDDGECRAILDSGTSLLGVPQQLMQKLHWLLARKVSSGSSATAERQQVDCRQESGSLLRFEVEQEGFEVQLEAKDYSRPAPMTVPSKTGGAATSVCRASLLPVETERLGPKTFLWGEPMLRKYYTTYDAGEKRIGVAQARQAVNIEQTDVAV
jgi:saccharopepsin